MKGITIITKLIVIATLFASCTGERYNVLHTIDKGESIVTAENSGVPKIRIGQELCVGVGSINEESAKYFRTSTEREGATGIECLYYRVDENGNITMPLLGAVSIVGLNLEEAETVVEKRLEKLIKEPAVRIQYNDFSVSVLGEVSLPGEFPVSTGRITIYEALAQAGGLTQFSKREDVLVIRQNGDKISHVRLNLTKQELWNTDYYYLHDKDVIMVSSNSGRIANSKNLPAWGTVLVGLGTVTAIIATRQ